MTPEPGYVPSEVILVDLWNLTKDTESMGLLTGHKVVVYTLISTHLT